MKRNVQKITTITGAIIIGLVVFSGLLFGPLNFILPENLREKLGYNNEESSTPEPLTVDLYVDFNKMRANINQTITFNSSETATAYNILLKANLSVTVISYPNELFITSIANISQDNHHYWWYYIDGVDGTVAADRCNLRTNNITEVIWEYKEN
ncbi:MAG: DUF4430 domain-containing protein [Asgard group archaeon]|nr:DUF4430 domain-containing protein [Asgard group archaeon]